jgi:hypothetical protein
MFTRSPSRWFRAPAVGFHLFLVRAIAVAWGTFWFSAWAWAFLQLREAGPATIHGIVALGSGALSGLWFREVLRRPGDESLAGPTLANCLALVLAIALSGGPGGSPALLIPFVLTPLALLVERADSLSRIAASADFAASPEVTHEGYQAVARPSSVEFSS